jgi:hypothetical protein
LLSFSSLSVTEPDGELARVESVGELVGTHKDFDEEDEVLSFSTRFTTDIAHTGFIVKDSFFVQVGPSGTASLP